MAGTTVVDRDLELSLIADCLEQARQGTGRLIWVEGPTGIGKSTLLGAVPTAGMHLLRARGSALECDFPHGVLRQLVEKPLLEASATQRERWLRGRASAVAALVDPDSATTVPGEFALLHGFYWLMINLADDRPLVVVVDDLQWCDQESRRALAFLASRLHDLPLLMLVATRPGSWRSGTGSGTDAGTRDREELWRLAHHSIELPGLTASGVRAVVETGLGKTPTPAFVEACLRATGGVPFHVAALTVALARGENEADESALALVEQAAPPRVARLILSAAAECGPIAITLCRALAVLGETTPTVLADVADLSSRQVSEVCDALRGAGLVATDAWELTHPIVARCILDEMPLGDREQLRLRAASALLAHTSDGQKVGALLVDVAPGQREWVAEALVAAAAEATRRAGHAEAARLLRRAREEYGGESPLAVDLALAAAELRNGSSRAAGLLAELETRARGTEAWPEVVRLRAQALAYAGDLDGAADLLGAAVAELIQPEAAELIQPEAAELIQPEAAELIQPEAAELLVDQYFYLIVTERTHEALELGRRAMRAVEETAAPGRGVLRGALALHAVHRNEPAAGIIHEAHTAWEQARIERGEVALHRRADAVLALVLCGALDLAEAAAVQLLQEAEERGERAGVAIGHYLRAQVLARRGLLLEAEAEVRDALAHAEVGLPLATPLAWALLVEVRLEAVGVDAVAELAHGAPRGAAVSAAGPADAVRLAQGRLWAVRGEEEAALAGFLECGAQLARRGGKGVAQFPWRTEAALAAHSLGRVDQARSLVEEALQAAEEFGAPQPLVQALLVAARLGVGEPAHSLERAVEVASPTGHLLETARARIALGAEERRRGAITRAKELLRAGLEVADRCGAAPLADFAAAELRVCGARPRRNTVERRALTASEARVARLAAAGATNRDIAMQLFVTVKTVEVHLTNCYRKLGIGSRLELDEALTSEP